MFTAILLALIGIICGVVIGVLSGSQYGIAAAIAGGLLGAPAGLGLAILHIRLVTWLASPDLADNSRLTGIQAWICVFLYAMGSMFCLWFSFLGTLLVVAFLLNASAHERGDLSREQCLVLFSSIAVGGYLLLWGVHRLVLSIESRLDQKKQ